MAEIFKFPNFDERAWRAIEDAYADGLRRTGVPEEGTAWIISEWKRRINYAMPSLQIPSTTVPDGLTPTEHGQAVGLVLINHFQERLENMAGQLLLAIIELYQAQPGVPSSPKKTTAEIFKMIPGGKDKSV